MFLKWNVAAKKTTNFYLEENLNCFISSFISICNNRSTTTYSIQHLQESISSLKQSFFANRNSNTQVIK